MKTFKTQANEIEFTRIDNDVNGNPRYVFHFLHIDADYDSALKIAKKIGGRKYHTKSYGGGIVIQSYNIRQTEQDILNIRH